MTTSEPSISYFVVETNADGSIHHRTLEQATEEAMNLARSSAGRAFGVLKCEVVAYAASEPGEPTLRAVKPAMARG